MNNEIINICNDFTTDKKSKSYIKYLIVNKHYRTHNLLKDVRESEY